MRQMHVWAGLGIAVLVVVLTGWLVFAPGWAVTALEDRSRGELGLAIDVTGGASLNFSPQLSIRFDGVRIAAANGDGALATAAALSIPVGWMDILGHRLPMAAMTLHAPELGFTINDRGETSWPQTVPAPAGPLRLVLEQAAVRFYDTRNSQGFSFAGANLLAIFSPDGALAVNGTAELNDRLAQVEGQVKSIARISQDGSPFDLVLSSPDLKVDASGRLATGKVLGLAGTVHLAGSDIAGAARWVGLGTGRESGQRPFEISGALETAGRALAVKQAGLSIDGMTARGDVSLDFRGEIPSLQAEIAMPILDLDRILPASGAGAGDWGRNPLGLGALKVSDAVLSISTDQVIFGKTQMGAAHLSVTIDKGRLSGLMRLGAIAGGLAVLEVGADGSTAPPSLSVSFAAQQVEAGAILPSIGINGLSGRGNITASLKANGSTQQELVGTLSGDASVDLADGAIRGVDMAALLADASKAIVNGWTRSETAATGFSAFRAAFALEDGIATLKDLKLASPSLAMTGNGDVDLLRRSVDLKTDPRVATGDGSKTAGLPVPLVIRGPWSKPRIYPDLPDILSNSAAAFENLKTMGLQANPVAPGDN
ncbi:MAG: AsmA family protein [Alphaproteobacteria bacterium]|nr:AsmA family protein [Alphaproteobacteria bacterium]